MEKFASENPDSDVTFRLSTKEELDLAVVARSASYSYSSDSVSLEQVPEQPVEEDKPPRAIVNPIDDSCADGIMIQDSCFFVSELSCEEACQEKGSSVKLTAMQALSKNECRSIYEELSPRSLILGMRDREIFVNGYGCYASGRGSVITKKGLSKPISFPPLIGSRSCSCQ